MTRWQTPSTYRFVLLHDRLQEMKSWCLKDQWTYLRGKSITQIGQSLTVRDIKPRLGYAGSMQNREAEEVNSAKGRCMESLHNIKPLGIPLSHPQTASGPLALWYVVSISESELGRRGAYDFSCAILHIERANVSWKQLLSSWEWISPLFITGMV